jgi:hypothetical protein
MRMLIINLITIMSGPAEAAMLSKEAFESLVPTN